MSCSTLFVPDGNKFFFLLFSLLRLSSFGPADTPIADSGFGLGRTSARIVKTPNDVTKA